MCGIAGYCLNANDKERVNINDLVSIMLLDIEHRGKHATGTAWLDRLNGKRCVSKAPIKASEFIMGTTDLCNGATTAILHTRFATQGSATNNNNNHPILRGNVVLTHNGHVSNDDALFKRLGVPRVAQVDSEALCALVAFSDGKPAEYLKQVQGTAAIAWLVQGKKDTLHLARLNGSPLWLGQSKSGSLFYGSTRDTVENAMVIANVVPNWIYEAQEGEYFKCVQGAIVEYEKFEVNKSVQSFKRYKYYGDIDYTDADDWDWSSMEYDYYKRSNRLNNKERRYQNEFPF